MALALQEGDEKAVEKAVVIDDEEFHGGWLNWGSCRVFLSSLHAMELRFDWGICCAKVTPFPAVRK